MNNENLAAFSEESLPATQAFPETGQNREIVFSGPGEGAPNSDRMIDTATKNRSLNRNTASQEIGLPMERYKPRPSRSRATKIEENPEIDYSVRPEKAAKKKSRRSRTIGVELARELEVQENRGVHVLETSPPVYTGAVPASITETQSTKPPKKRKNSKSEPDELASLARTGRDVVAKGKEISVRIPKAPQVVVNRVTDEEKAHTEAHDDVLLPNLTESLDSVESGNGRAGERDIIAVNGTKRKRRKTSETMAVEDPVPADGISVPEPTKEKKRGRGRPRLRPKTPVPDDPKEGLPRDGTPNGDGGRSAEPESFTPATKGPIGDHPELQPELAPSEAKIAKESPKISSAKDEGQMSRNETPKKQIQPANPKHSPLSKGKVPFRVGLSKRARIAPLLKMVKK